MNITIVGAGNIGTQFAVRCAQKGHAVTVYGSKPEKISKHLIEADENGCIKCEGEIVEATNDAGKAFSCADVIFVTVPAFCMREVADKVFPYMKKGVKIGLIPGTGGGECAFKNCMENEAVIFGLQRVPGVARLIEYGKKVCVIGYREELHLSALPKKYTEECCSLLKELFDMPCRALPNYLNLTLTPSNPILHTTRLRILFQDYKEGVTYERVPLFYQEWDDETSQLLFRCDEEVQQICRNLNMFELKDVRSLKTHYESDTPEQLTKKIRSIKGFRGLKTPTIEKQGAFIPDLHSRYFTADFSFGLAILIQIAEFLNLRAENMKEVMGWYEKIRIEDKKFDYKDYGINHLEDFCNFYNY